MLYSDGIDEAFNESREQFGQHRLMASLKASERGNIAPIGTDLFDQVDAFSGAEEQSDDITVMLIQHRPHYRFFRRDNLMPDIAWSIDLSRSSLSAINKLLQAFVDEHDLGESVTFTLRLVVEEATLNIRNYAELQGELDLILALTPDSLVLQFSYEGVAFHWQPLTSSENTNDTEIKIGGLGLEMIHQFSSDVRAFHLEDDEQKPLNVLQVTLGLNG